MKNIYIINFITSFLYFKIYSSNDVNSILKRFGMKKYDTDENKSKINVNVKNIPNEDIKNLKKNLSKNKYNFQKDMNITEAESCKQMNEMFNKPDALNNINKLFTGRSDEDKRNILDFLLKHSAFIDFLDKDISYIENTYNSLKNLEKDIKNEELVSLYDAMLATPELVNLLKNTDPKNIEKLNETIKLYSKIDKKEKVPIENTFEYVYKTFVYYTCVAEYVKLFKTNKYEFKKIFRDIIKPAFNDYIMNLSALIYIVKNDPKNKKSIELLKKDIKSTIDSLTKTVKKQMDDYNLKGVEEGVKRKINGCKMSCKESKVFLM